MKSAGKARNNGLYRHIRTSKEIIRNLLNDYHKNKLCQGRLQYVYREIRTGFRLIENIPKQQKAAGENQKNYLIL